ncbi:MAG TPA: SRPBCC domain-containing protein [Pseudonocardiaceae bacterium]|nr:SRPBCC domain-containing protein [Pseudonocardiaceae bacterium]
MATLKKRIRIAAPLSTVHGALTDPAALRVWLAEQATVELPHRYEFWGRFTPSGDVPRQRLLHADDHSLRFTWELDGITTTVDIGLAAEDGDTGSTLLTLAQDEILGWPEVVLDDAGDRALMHTYWALALANLADYAEGREPTALCDFTSPVLRHEIPIDADRLAVYASLTEPEQFSRWFGAKVEAELYPGGRFAMGGFDANPQPAHVVDIQEGRSMSIDWGDMVQTWELADSDGRTRLTFVHSGFDENMPPYSGWLGTLGGVAELRRYNEVKNWRSMWVEVQLDGMPDGLLSKH